MVYGYSAGWWLGVGRHEGGSLRAKSETREPMAHFKTSPWDVERAKVVIRPPKYVIFISLRRRTGTGDFWIFIRRAS